MSGRPQECRAVDGSQVDLGIVEFGERFGAFCGRITARTYLTFSAMEVQPCKTLVVRRLLTTPACLLVW